jgi:hypothetical protein
MRLRFAPPESRVALTPSLAAALGKVSRPREPTTWADHAAELLDRAPFGLVFQIGALRLPLAESRALALAVAATIKEALQRRGAPRALRLEVEEGKDTYVVAGHQTRTLLPHHDGAHRSYLTPSTHEDPGWDPALRTMSDQAITTTCCHNLYQGFFVADPGEGLSVTTFYDKVAILREACTRAGGNPSLAEVAGWAGANVERAWTRRHLDDIRYLTLGAALGAPGRAFAAVPVHWAEAPFTPDQLEAFAELRAYAASPCPAEAFLDDLLRQALGLGWEAFRAEHERCIVSERFDYVLGHNLTNLHGGLMGGPTRHLEPISLVVDEPRGEEYEGWLSRSWRLHGLG